MQCLSKLLQLKMLLLYHKNSFVVLHSVFFSKAFLHIMNLVYGGWPCELSKAYKTDYFNINQGFFVIR